MIKNSFLLTQEKNNLHKNGMKHVTPKIKNKKGNFY